TAVTLYDGHSGVRQLTDASGSVTGTYTYDAFGNLTGSGGPAAGTNPYRYRGERVDAASGQYELRAPGDDPTNGRVLRADPEPGPPDDPLTLHRYLYAGTDPVNMADPTGRFATYVTLAVMSAAAAYGAKATAESVAQSAVGGYTAFVVGAYDCWLQTGSLDNA